MKHLVRWPILVWFVSVTMIVVMVAGVLASPRTATVSADSESDVPMDCLRCHTRVLKGHDKLGTGSEACRVCHDSTDMEMLHLVEGTQISSASSPQLCGQCHLPYYNAWKGGGHGTSTAVGIVKCADCHDPHQPQMTRLGVTEPRPPSVPESGVVLDCLSCHLRVLKGHDKLGTGSEACWACHYKTEMTTLHLAGGETQFPLSDFPRLCAQCHQERYKAWEEGIHGVPAWKAGEPAVPGAEKARCVNCHEPHQPQIALLNITQPHPPAEPSPPPPPTQALIMLGIALLVIVAVGVAVTRRGELP